VIDPAALEAKLREAFPDAARLEVHDLTGGRDHYRVVIESAAFHGKTRVEQHRMVYTALGDLMHGPIHALALETRAG
jgi:stress-induced morphogen